MKLSTVKSYAITGVSASPVHIEVHIANGLPSLSIVGLPEATVRESKDRVRSAILNSGFEYPAKRITINLAPANLPKYGSGFDLPIALGILLASEQINAINISGYYFAGELSLSGELRNITGALPMAVSTQSAGQTLILPMDNREALSITRMSQIFLAKTLADVCSYLSDSENISLAKPVYRKADNVACPCFSEVQGQSHAKRALEIAAAGGHSVLMQGPPGTGKSMLASRLAGIIPKLAPEQAIEVASIYSVSNTPLKNVSQPPFRSPHHTASSAALVGGGSIPMPGEISLAHRGILFLDELPEFSPKVLEVLRQPIETGEICISRAAAKNIFPARFQLIAAMNPCPCGFFGEERCHCSPERITRYQSRISGPLLDRIDMRLKLSRNQLQINHDPGSVETSQQIRNRVAKARQAQRERQNTLNADIAVKDLQERLNQDKELLKLAQQALDNMQLSMRALHRTMRVALTIADLERTEVTRTHFLEALGYRQDL